MPLRVDIATGATTLHEVDLVLPGFLPLNLARRYRSDNPERGAFGVGWTFSLDVELLLEEDRVAYRDATARPVYFRRVETGKQVTSEEHGVTLQHHPDAYVVLASPLLQQVFLKKNAAGDRLRLDHVEDADGHRVQFLYKGRHLIGLVDSAGRQVHCTYGDDLLTSITVVSPDGTEKTGVRSFRYEGDDLVAAADAARHETAYAYRDHLMVSCTNRLGGVRYAQYGADRRCLALWQGDGTLARRFGYDDLRQSARVAHADGQIVVYRTAQGQVQARIDAGGGTRNYYYDARRYLVGFADDRGAVSVFQHLDPAAGTFALIEGDRSALFAYDARGLASRVTVGAADWTMAYDDRGHPVGLTTPTGATWTFERDAEGRVTAVASPEGRRVSVRYDEAGRRRTVADDIGLCLDERYDLFGRLVERVDALERKEQRTYDAEGRLVAVKIEGGYEVRFTYDAEGRLTAAADSRQRIFKMEYDAYGRLAARTVPDGPRWQYQYDREGRLVEAQAQGQRARVTYDAHGRPTRIASPEGHEHTFHYEDAGRTEIRSDRAEAAYHPGAGLVEATTAEGASRRITCGPSGEWLAVETEQGTFSFSYDEDGCLTGIGRDGTELVLAYDRDGHLRSVANGAGETVALHYDARGRAVECRAGGHATCRVTYDAGDRITALACADGSRLSLAYDRLDRPETCTRADAQGHEEVHRFSSRDPAPFVVEVLRSGSEGPADAGSDVAGSPEDEADASVTASLDEAPPPADGEVPGPVSEQDAPDEAPGQGTYEESLQWLRSRSMGHRGTLLAKLKALGVGPEIVDPEPVTPNAAAPAAPDAAAADDRAAAAAEAPGAAPSPASEAGASSSASSTDPPVEAGDGDSGEAGAALFLYQSHFGLVLTVRLDGLELPVRFQPHYLAGAERSGRLRFVEAVLDGAGAVLGRYQWPRGPELWRYWVHAAAQRTALDYTEIPRSAQLNGPWSVLDRFFLERCYYDAAYPHRTPGFLAHYRADPLRSPDPMVTGPHVDALLKPRASVHGILPQGPDYIQVALGSHHPDDFTPFFSDPDDRAA